MKLEVICKKEGLVFYHENVKGFMKKNENDIDIYIDVFQTKHLSFENGYRVKYKNYSDNCIEKNSDGVSHPHLLNEAYVKNFIESAEKRISYKSEFSSKDILHRLVTLKTERQSGITYSTRSCVEECLNNDENIWVISYKKDSADHFKRQLNCKNKDRIISYNKAINDPSVMKNARFVIFDEIDWIDDKEGKSMLVTKMGDLNVGLIVNIPSIVRL